MKTQCILLVFLVIGLQIANVNAGKSSISIRPSELLEFKDLPSYRKQLIVYCLFLASKNYPYSYGKKSPKEGGFDCSGAVFHTLKQGGITNIPRTSYAQYNWVKKNTKINKVKTTNIESRQLRNLQPGDLLFWKNTYKVVDRSPPISHVMIYIGRLKSNGKRVMVGASSNRRFSGTKRTGYSVYNFTLPKKGSKGQFVGFGTIPGLQSYKLSDKFNKYIAQNSWLGNFNNYSGLRNARVNSYSRMRKKVLHQNLNPTLDCSNIEYRNFHHYIMNKYPRLYSEFKRL